MIIVYNDSRYIMLKVFWLKICESVQKTYVWKWRKAWVCILKIQKIYLEEVLKMILKMSIYMFITPFWNIIMFCKWIMNNCQDWVKGFYEMGLWTGMCKAAVFKIVQHAIDCTLCVNRLHGVSTTIFSKVLSVQSIAQECKSIACEVSGKNWLSSYDCTNMQIDCTEKQ